MSTPIIIGIVVLLGGVVSVFLYLRAQKRKEEERKEEEAKRELQQEKMKKEMEQERKRLRQKAEEETERKIKAMKAESDSKIARLERSAREAEKRRMERPRRRGTKEEERDFREMLLMITTILFKHRYDRNIRKTKQILATIRAGTADKETVKRWKSAWKLAKVKIRQRKEKRMRRLARLRERRKRQKVQLGRPRFRGVQRPRFTISKAPRPRPKWTRDAQGRKRLPDGRVWMGSSLGWRKPRGGRPERGGHPLCRQSNPYARKNCIRNFRNRNRNRKTCRKVGGCGGSGRF